MQHNTPEDSEDQTLFSPLEPLSASGALPQGNGVSSPAKNDHATAPISPEHETFFYTQDDDLDVPVIDEQDGQSSPFVLPFQHSAPMPTVVQPSKGHTRGPIATTPPSSSSSWVTQGRWFPLLKTLLIISVVVITLVIGGLLVLAQSAVPPTSTLRNGAQTRTTTGPSPARSTPLSKNVPTPGAMTSSTPTPSNQGAQVTGAQPAVDIPSQQMLSQMGWTQAGFSIADAVEALQTATTFVDREMSYDYRAIGTPVQHSGTFTASTFLLTPGGRVRFVQNDVRMINNVLYSKVRNGKIIQQVVGAQPQLVQFRTQQIQGQSHQFAWVTVSFELFQSSIDQATGKRTESIATDPATGQPRIHQMSVLLLRVAPQQQGVGAPMGGTGWLVNVYALDSTTLPAIATAPSL